MSTVKGGYDYKLLHSDDLCDDQQCPICLLLVRNAYQLNCCGRLFCESCLMHLVNQHGSCPMCRTIISGNYFKDTRADRGIKQLRVVCGHKSNGCDWSGELRSIRDHMDSCKYKEVECTDCGNRFPEYYMEKHILEDCVMRKIECDRCSEEGTYKFITSDHRAKCPKVLLRCRNSGCNATFMRYQSASHSESCLKSIVMCPFNRMGCAYNSQRENLPTHIEKMFKEHLEMIAKTTQAHIDAPVTVKMTKFEECKARNGIWYSDAFYTGPGGYKVRLKVHPNGIREYKSTHMSVFINILPGENDDNLQFPLLGKFTVELLNQVADASHHSANISFTSKTPEKNACRKVSVDGNAHGIFRFIEQSCLYQTNDNIKYLVNDVIYLRVRADISSQTKPWLAVTGTVAT